MSDPTSKCILLINPPIRENALPDCIPFGIGSIASVLEKKGYFVEIWDLNILRITKEEIIKKIDFVKYFDVIGIGGLITTYNFISWLVPFIRKHAPNSIIIVGGGVCSAYPELFFKNNLADIAVIGEGEVTCSELIPAIFEGVELSSIPGIYFQKDDKIMMTSQRKLIENIDTLPYIAWHKFDVEKYMKNVSHAKLLNKKSELTVITSRGCPYRCNYCYHIFGNSARYHSVSYSINYIKYLKETFNPESFLFNDEMFTLSKNRVFEFCEAYLKEKISIPWSCYARVNNIDHEMLTVMKESGCYRIGYGLESGSQSILDNMNKKATVIEAEEAIKITRKVGIYCGYTFMFGYPGESLSTINETIYFCRRNSLEGSMFFTTPYPGTKIFYDFESRIMAKYGSVESFIKKLGDADQFVINLTAFGDEELIMHHKNLIKKINKKDLMFICYYLRNQGMNKTLSRIVNKLYSFVKDR